MTKKFTRRLSAAVLSACLALSPAGVFAEHSLDQSLFPQIQLSMFDGSSVTTHIQSVDIAAGETVYWADMSYFTEEAYQVLSTAQLLLCNAAGEIMGHYLFSEINGNVITLYRVDDPENTVSMILADHALPEDPQEAAAMIAEYGFSDDHQDGSSDWSDSDRFSDNRGNRGDRGDRNDRNDRNNQGDQNDWNDSSESSRFPGNRDNQDRHDREEAARQEAERLAAEEAARIEAERLAAEEAARIEAERLAAEEAARIEAERLAAEEAARIEAERLAAEEAARIEAERIAAEEAARIEAERLAAEEAARIEAERIAAEEAAKQEQQTPDFDELYQNIVVPGYVVPFKDNTNLRLAPLMSDDTLLIQVNTDDVLTVSGNAIDAEGRVWWQATDYRTGTFGFILADVCQQVDEDVYRFFAEDIDHDKVIAAEKEAQAEADRIAAEEAARAEAERIAAEEAARIEAERLAAEEAARIEAERLAAEEAARIEAERLAAEEAARIEAERLAAEEAARIEAERLAAEEAARIEAERLAAEEAAKQEQHSAVRYAVTSNRNNPTSNLRAKANSKSDVVGVYENGELLIWDEPTEDGKWYPVTVVRDGAQGYMRDYLLTEISEADAQLRMAEILAGKAEEIQPEATDPNYPELIVPDHIQNETGDSFQDNAYESGNDADNEVGNEVEIIVPDDQENETSGSMIDSFPAYAMTRAQENNVAIVLREEPAGGMPQSGAVPMIIAPTPLEITEEKLDPMGNTWLHVRNMNNGETGYIEAYKVELVSREIAEANVVPQINELPPVPSDNPENEPENESENEPEIIQPEEPEIPDTPQTLTQGDVYHYGRNTGRQVGLRKAPNKDRIYNMEKGTVLWVMSFDGEWCHVRTDRAEGYVMAKYVELMGEREEAEYIASIDDPETAPERDETEIIQPEVTDPNYPELIVPEKTEAPTEIPSEPTPTPAPQEIERLAVVIRDNTQLRSNPTMDAYLQSELAVDGVVYAMRTEMNDEGELWTLVQLENEWGYVLTDHIRLMSEREQERYLAALEAAKATPTPTLEPTATPRPTKTPAPQRLDLFARVINDGTPLRGNPDPNAYLQDILEEETVVFLFQSQIAEDGMTWYLVQHSGQWGYIRADLVRPMGHQETEDYLAQLEAELATPTPMPQVTPEPVGPDSTSAYAKLIKDKVNLRRTPSSSGTSLDRVPIDTLLLVLGSEYDGTYTWYQVSYEGNEGYIRSDMAKMLTIAELERHFQEQMEQAQQQSKPGVSVTPNKNNNTDIVINGSQLQDLIPVDNSWTNNVISGMPLYGTATPDPNATPTPQPPEKSAALIRSSGNISVSNVPALTREASFAVYGKTKAYSTVTATVEMPAANTLPTTMGMSLIPAAIAENTTKRTVGQAVSDANGLFEMNVTLPQEGEYIVEFASADGAFAQYGVTYDTGATPMPTIVPLPTAMPVEEEDEGLMIWPFIIGGLLIVVAAAVYGVYVYRRRSEEEEDEEDEDEEADLRQAQLNMQRQRAANAAQSKAPTSTVIPGAQRMPKAPGASATQAPSYTRNAQQSPYARPQTSQTPTAPEMPKAPIAPAAPVAPKAPEMPKAPIAPAAPKAPEMPKAPASEQIAENSVGDISSTPRRRRRPPTDPNA